MSNGKKSIVNFLKKTWKFLSEGANKMHMPKLHGLKKTKTFRKMIGGVLTSIYVFFLLFLCILLFELVGFVIVASLYGISYLISSILFPNSGDSSFLIVMFFNYAIFIGMVIFFFAKGNLIKRIKDFYER